VTPGAAGRGFFDSYVTDLVTRNVRQISDIERPAEMRRMLSVVAARMGPWPLPSRWRGLRHLANRLGRSYGQFGG
jgi:hypothetical protein